MYSAMAARAPSLSKATSRRPDSWHMQAITRHLGSHSHHHQCDFLLVGTACRSQARWRSSASATHWGIVGC